MSDIAIPSVNSTGATHALPVARAARAWIVSPMSSAAFSQNDSDMGSASWHSPSGHPHVFGLSPRLRAHAAASMA